MKMWDPEGLGELLLELLVMELLRDEDTGVFRLLVLEFFGDQARDSCGERLFARDFHLHFRFPLRKQPRLRGRAHLHRIALDLPGSLFQIFRK